MHQQNKPRGHHYIPQFLLKEFASRLAGDEAYTFVFPTGKDSYESNVKNVAKVRDFHEMEGDFSLESRISVTETSLAAVHRQLLAGRDLPTHEELVRFTLHFVVRSKMLRDTVIEVGEAVLDAFSEPRKKTKAYLKRQMLKGLKKELAKTPKISLAINRLPKYRKRLIQRMLTKQAQEITKTEFPVYAAQLRDLVDLPQLAKDSHNKVLNKDLDPEGWIKRAASLQWRVEETTSNVILGDVCLMVLDERQETFEHSLMGSHKLELALMPINKNKILVGTRSRMALNLPEINLWSARRSKQFFISAERTTKELALHGELGASAALFDPSTLL